MMNLLELTPKCIDEHDLLMLIARHVQFDPLCFGDSVKVIHLKSDATGMTKIIDVVEFADCETANKYYHSNGNTTRPLILVRPDSDGTGLMLSGEKYFVILKVFTAEILIEHKGARSRLPSRRKLFHLISEESLLAGMMEIRGLVASASSKKAG